MKPSAPELAALQAVAGPRPTPQEIETAARLADYDAAARHIDGLTFEEKAARSKGALSAVVRPADAEAMRAAFWLKLPLSARRVACMAANMPKERAEDTLNKFDAFERGRVFVALQTLMNDLDVARKCMQGGAMPISAKGVH